MYMSTTKKSQCKCQEVDFSLFNMTSLHPEGQSAHNDMTVQVLFVYTMRGQPEPLFITGRSGLNYVLQMFIIVHSMIIHAVRLSLHDHLAVKAVTA